MTGSNLISLRHWDIELSQCTTVNGETEMSDTGMRRTGILQIVMLLTVAASVNAGGIMDTARSITEHLWEQEYIPDSGQPTVPLSEYDEFDVVELFRAETIEDLETAMTDGYPMPWLEEILKDESIPWEDRYWLDRRVRAAIAQNTHTFFSATGEPVLVDADDVFPGEYYWREHLIIDPVGRSTTVNETGPVQPLENNPLDSGEILNPYGRKVGTLAIVWNGMSLSRDASIGLFVTGRTGELVSYGYQHYACLLYPDGTFNEIPFEDTGAYGGTLSADGNVLAFFRQGGPSTGSSFIEVMDREGHFLRRIPFDGWFEHMLKPPISADGRYASCILINPGAHSAVFDLENGELIHVTEHTGTDRNTTHCSFSPDNNFISIGGTTRGRVISLFDGLEYAYPETAPRDNSYDRTNVSCSSNRILTAITIARSAESQLQSTHCVLYTRDDACVSFELNSEVGVIAPEFSPNGYFVLVSPYSYGLGGCYPPSPMIVLHIEEGR